MSKTITYPKLPKGFKKKWLEALRSGDYEQGTFRLYRDDNTFCCLGVACVVAGHRMGFTDDGEAIISKYRYRNVPSMIKGNSDLVSTLAEMNDGNVTDGGKSFKYIANRIDKNL